VSADVNSAEQVQSAQPKLHIRSARELFGALEASDGTTRLAALQAVRKAPATALSFGLHARRDVIDVLISQAEHFRGEWEWFHWIGALAGFRDPRVVRLFTFLITTESHAELLFALANYLRAEPLERLRYQLGTALMQNECVARARAAATLLAGRVCLFTAEALRIGLLEPPDNVGLPLFPAAIHEWLSELAGPFQSEARMELQRQGLTTLTALVDYWDRFSEGNKRWLLEWATTIDAHLVLSPIREVLTTRPDGLILTALEAAANLKELPDDLDARIAALVHDRDELVRRAAIMLCRSVLDWRQLFANEQSVLVRQACIARMIDQEGQRAVPFALQQLISSDWRIRAAAAEGLCSLGKSGIRAAFALLPEAAEPVRASVARMVIQSANESLLEEFLRYCSQAQCDD